MAEIQAPPPLPKSQPSFGRRNNTIIKLLGVGALVLVLLIPLVMITGVLNERLAQRDDFWASPTTERAIGLVSGGTRQPSQNVSAALAVTLLCAPLIGAKAGLRQHSFFCRTRMNFVSKETCLDGRVASD